MGFVTVLADSLSSKPPLQLLAPSSAIIEQLDVLILHTAPAQLQAIQDLRSQ